MEDLRFIINELNKHFETDYNMISFDSLSDTELLQVLVNVLSMVNAIAKVDVAKNKEQAILDILRGLQSLKYVPEKEISSTDFREGLIIGRRNIIHPILFWVLSNTENVKKRVYFANFAEKVEVPPELMSDPEIEQMNQAYDKLIEEFWTSYNENGKEKKNSAESSELHEDTKKMSTDMNFLLQRIDLQNEKLKNVPNRETLISSVKSYRNEMKQREKLEDQLKDQKSLLLQLTSDAKSLQTTLNQNAGKRPENMDPLQQISEELQINKILYDGQLPREYDEIAIELEAFQKVAQEPEPMQEEISALNTEIETLGQQVQTLMNKKIALTNTNDDQLLPFRNQATIIANKKQELSNFIMKIKTKNEHVLEQTNLKVTTLRELVGGDLLHGEELKHFINNLRERSLVYKKHRAYLQGLQAYVGNLIRTLEILKREDPTVADAILSAKNNNSTAKQEAPTDDVSELKTKCKSLFKEANTLRAESERVYDDLIKLRIEYNRLTDNFYETKREFDNATGNLTGDIDKFEQTFEELESSIKKEETEWKDTMKSVENYEVVMQKYSHALDSSTGMVALIEKLTDTLRVNEKNKKELLKKLEQIKEMKSVEQEEMNQLQRIKQMILFKLEAS